MLPFELTKDTPYLALSGELSSVFCEYFNRNWLCYKGFLLYVECSVPVTAAMPSIISHHNTKDTLVTTTPWASCQIRKNTGCACAGNAGNVFPRRRFQRKLLYSDPGMHHGTCRDACRDRLPAVTGKTFPAFPAHAHPQFCVSGKRPMGIKMP